MPKTARELAKTIEYRWSEAEREGRDLTLAERREMTDLVEQAKSQHALEKSMGDIGGSFPNSASTDPNYVTTANSPGEQFVNSSGFKAIQDSASRGQSWSTGMVELKSSPWAMKGTLTESGGGGAALAVPVPQVIPGVVDKLFNPLTLEAILSRGLATTNTVRYVTQGTATSGAAGVLETGLKPESTIGLTTVDEPVKKIATTLVVSDEMLDDSAAVSSFINSQLSLYVQIETERQLLRGTSGGAEVQGILTSRNVPIYGGGTAAGTKAEQIFKALNGNRGSAFTEPDFLVIHPTDWQEIRLAKDTANQYYGGGPFNGPYGSGQNAAASGQITGALDNLWGKPVYVSPIVGAGTALAGSSAAAAVWSRGGLSVEASNSHSDYFQRNLVMVRAERRLALAVYRPSSLVEIRLA